MPNLLIWTSGITGLAIHGIDCGSRGLLYESEGFGLFDDMVNQNGHTLEKRQDVTPGAFLLMITEMIGMLLTGAASNPVLLPLVLPLTLLIGNIGILGFIGITVMQIIVPQ